MDEATSQSSEYIHGNSPEEQHRLTVLNGILNDACLRELHLQPGEKVLDFGSGLGQFTRLIAHAVGEQGHVIGIERDQDQLAQAKWLADQAGETNLVEFRNGDVRDLQLAETELKTFDLAHARFLLEHVSQPEKVIAQMVRAIRPGGRIFVSDDDHGNFRPWPQPEGFPVLWDAYVRSYEQLGNDPYIGRRLVSLLQEGGLTAIRNTCVFFGGCAGNERFEAIADNLIGVLEGAKATMLDEGLLDENSFDTGIRGLHIWRKHPSAVLWYFVCCAEGIAPEKLD